MSSSGSRDSEAAAVNSADLAALRSDIGDEALHRYLLAYVDLLGARLDRMERAIGAEEAEDAVDAVVDLGVSSTMVGAVRLAALARASEQDLREGLLADFADKLPAVRSEAAAVSSALRKVLSRGGTGRPPPHGPLKL